MGNTDQGLAKHDGGEGLCLGAGIADPAAGKCEEGGNEDRVSEAVAVEDIDHRAVEKVSYMWEGWKERYTNGLTTV